MAKCELRLKTPLMCRLVCARAVCKSWLTHPLRQSRIYGTPQDSSPTCVDTITNLASSVISYSTLLMFLESKRSNENSPEREVYAHA